MTLGYPTSSATKVIWLPANGKLTVTVIHVSPDAPLSGVATEILASALEDVSEYILPILNDIFENTDEEESQETDESDEDKQESEDSGTDYTQEARHGVREDDVTLRVIIEFPETEISTLSLAHLIDGVIGVGSQAFQRAWMLLDSEDYEQHLAMSEAASQAEKNLEETGIRGDGSRIVVLPLTSLTSITPLTPPENHLWN